MNELIAIVDDEPDIVELVSTNLKRSNYRVNEYLFAKEFLSSIEDQVPDLIILDLMLPDIDGIEVCKFLKDNEKTQSVPIIMLTARSDDGDKILGLELGADDYVTKPFSPKVLVARVKAILRRRKKAEQVKNINIGNIMTIDLQKYEVVVNGEKVSLTSTEFRILKILAEKKGWVFTRGQLLDYLWGNDKAVLDRTIDVHIKHLREKLGDEAGKLIKNVRGIGYKLDV